MSEEWTPSFSDIKDAWLQVRMSDGEVNFGDASAEFNRWLGAVKRKHYTLGVNDGYEAGMIDGIAI